MPLWMQGAIELLMTAVLSFATVLILLVAVWFAGGFNDASLLGVSQLSSQIWLLIHGVPLDLNIPQHGSFAAVSGTFSLIPLGLTLVPLALCFRSGRRLAQASYEGQFWVPLVSGSLTYLAISLALSLFSSTATVTTHPLLAFLVPLWVVLLGTICGAWFESRSLARMIGVNAAEWVGKFSQYSRWAGSYVWAVLRSSLVALLAFIAGGALLFALTVLYNWNDILAVYQLLSAGAVGDTAVTLLQLGIVPNLIIWAMAWSTGAGFSFGEGTIANLSQTSVGAMPALPVLGAIPQPIDPFSYLAVLAPILAGALAGWWFFRAGENHFDEWVSLKIRFRWLSALLSTLCLAVFIAVPTGIMTAAVGWFAHGSLGLGRFTHVGPTPWFFGLLTALWVAVGVLLGSILAPIIEPDNSKELDRFAGESRENKRRLKKEQKKAKAAQKAEKKAARSGSKGSKAANSVATETESEDVFVLDEAEESPADSAQQQDAAELTSTEANVSADSAEEGEVSAEKDSAVEPAALEPAQQYETSENLNQGSVRAEESKAAPEQPKLARGAVIRRPKSLKKQRTTREENDS